MKISFKRIAAILVVAAVAGFALIVMRPDPPQRDAAPTIGGPFTLVNHLGETVTDADFRGRFLLIFFGYTYCPDVCPTTLTAITDALDLLGPEGGKVTAAFVSVDPVRDRPEYLAEYLAYFHPRLVGLTGSTAQVAVAAEAYRVYFAKDGQGVGAGGSQADIPAPHAHDASGQGGEQDSIAPHAHGKNGQADEGDYIMDHTAVIYLMGPAGKFLAHFAHETSPEDMATGIRRHLGQ